jgi:hypothetical protein
MKKILLLAVAASLVLVNSVWAASLEFYPSSFNKDTGVITLTFTQDLHFLGTIDVKGVEVVNTTGKIVDGDYVYVSRGAKNYDTGSCTIRNGKLNGLYRMVYFNKNRTMDINYVNNLADGTMRVYNSSNKKADMEKIYTKGKLIKTIK